MCKNVRIRECVIRGDHQMLTIFCTLYYFCFNMLISNLRVLFLPACKIQHFKAFLYVEDVGLGLDMLD